MKNGTQIGLLVALVAALASQGRSDDAWREPVRRLPPLSAQLAPAPSVALGIDSIRLATTERGIVPSVPALEETVFPLEEIDGGWSGAKQPLTCACATPCLGSCQIAATHKTTGFIDLNYYWDNRDFNVMTINAGAKLPYDFEYFQFLNLFGDMGQSAARGDWSSFYTEINLRRPIAKNNSYLKHLDFTLQFTDGSGPPEVGRLGIRWRVQDTPGPIGDFFRDVLKLKYSINFHLLETDGTGWQIEHVYRREFLDKRIYVSAFCDHNINDATGSSTWVTEHQIGVRLIDHLYAVSEYRYSSFAPPDLRSGWGLGLEYVIRFN